MLLITYSCEHNHPWPASRNTHRSTTAAAAAAAAAEEVKIEPDQENQESVLEMEKKVPEIVVPVEEKRFEECLIVNDEFGWFSDLESTSSTMLESPILDIDGVGDADVAMIFTMREEDESLFADLGELPECSVVFRRGGMMEREEERRRCRLDSLA
jgi:hypothetical protein